MPNKEKPRLEENSFKKKEEFIESASIVCHRGGRFFNFEASGNQPLSSRANNHLLQHFNAFYFRSWASVSSPKGNKPFQKQMSPTQAPNNSTALLETGDAL